MSTLLRPPQFDDPSISRLARSLHSIALAGLLASLGYGLLVALFPATGQSISPLISIGLHAIILLAARTRFVLTVARVYVSILWGLLAASAYQHGGLASPFFLALIVAIMCAGALFGLRASLAFTGASGLLGLILFIMESRGLLPVPELAFTPGELLILLTLTFAFASAIIYIGLRDLTHTLAGTSEAHSALHERATGLEAAAEVGRAAASFHSLDELLPKVTRLIGERFDFYHVSIYLNDRSGKRLVMRAANSSAGRQMISGGHGYNLGDHGIISQVGMSGQLHVSPDTRTDPLHRLNPLLPNTRAELALPLIAGNTQYGVLDVQSNQPNALNPESVKFLSVLADQVAIAIQNAFLLDEAQERNRLLASLARVGSALTASIDLQSLLDTICNEARSVFGIDSAFIWLLDGLDVVGFAGNGPGREDFVKLRLPLDDQETLGVRVIRERRAYIVNDARTSELVSTSLVHTFNARAIMGVPLLHGDVCLGSLVLLDSHSAHRFTPADQEAAQLFASQIASTMDNARLFRATRRRVDELTVLQGISLAGLEAVDEDELIRRATTLIGRTLYPDNFGFLTYSENRQQLLHHPSYWEGEHKSPPIPALSRGLCWEVARAARPQRVADVRTLEDYVEIDPHTRSELCVPLYVAGQVEGVINTENHRINAFSEDDERLLTTVAAQVGIVIEKLRLSKEEERRASELRGLYEIAEAFKTMTDVQETYGTLVERLARLLGADTCIVALIDPITGYLIAQKPGFGVTDEVLNQVSISPTTAGRLWNARALDVHHSNSPSENPVIFETLSSFLPIQNLLAAPMSRNERFLGVVFALNKRGGFTDDDTRLLAVFSSQAAAVIENTRLYADAQERAIDLARALAKQEELDRLKSEFVQNVSHELRTPLSIIKGYIELLDSGELGEMPPDFGEPIGIIRRRVDMLNKMISDLTALLETENVGLRPQMVDLRSLVEFQLEDFAVVAERARLNLKRQLAPEIPALRGDPEMLRRVLDNLLGNALKFTPVRGTIAVRLFRQDNEIVLEVSDTGSGIPESELDRIFERFYQIDGSSTRKHGGTGLGLALVKEICEKHSGTVTVQSRLNFGTTFRVALPIDPALESHPVG
ncbi:MAG: GAF domain-containing protein [Anaerolineae bacterium]|nr:MAG: GAF domain-containing protein [Anaerolineae bacterium]